MTLGERLTYLRRVRRTQRVLSLCASLSLGYMLRYAYAVPSGWLVVGIFAYMLWRLEVYGYQVRTDILELERGPREN